MQDQARHEGRRIHEFVTPVEPDKGLAALPESSDADVFFDLEGDAFAADGGLEYLFGVADRAGNYNASWALDPRRRRSPARAQPGSGWHPGGVRLPDDSPPVVGRCPGPRADLSLESRPLPQTTRRRP